MSHDTGLPSVRLGKSVTKLRVDAGRFAAPAASPVEDANKIVCDNPRRVEWITIPASSTSEKCLSRRAARANRAHQVREVTRAAAARAAAARASKGG